MLESQGLGGRRTQGANAAIPVTVAILTYRRPDVLRRGLEAVSARIVERRVDLAGYEVEVLVVDNDPGGSARLVVASVDSAVPVRYVVEPRPGIGAARQRALDESRHRDVLVFVDDDEVPCRTWLDHLLHTWSVTGAAAVAGRVVPRYETVLDPWIEAGQFFVRRDLPTGTAVESAPAGNLLIDLVQVRSLGVGFDPRFGLTGGEDTLFTRQLRRRGGVISFCRESKVIDIVPSERMTRRWVLRRAWSHGNTTAHVEVTLASGWLRRACTRTAVALGGFLRIAGGGSRALYGAATRDLSAQARGLRLLCRGGGMVVGAAGRMYEEYARGR